MMTASSSSILLDWVGLTRWREWIQSKLPFLTALAALLLPTTTAGPPLLAIVVTITAGAAFGYGLNEVADRASDARAGRSNRAAALGRRRWLAYLILTAAGALGLSLVWAPDSAAPLLVVTGLGLAMAYSLPPLRLKGRGWAGLLGAAAAQWAVPVLVVSAADPQGWLRLSTWSFALLGLAIGTRWMVAHQLRDAASDRRSGVRTYLSGRGDAAGLLLSLLVCELALLGVGLASLWPRSAPAVIALTPFVAWELLGVLRRGSLPVRLSGYDEAPLAAYYFLALPLALALDMVMTGRGSLAVSILLVAVALPQLVARSRWWLGIPGSAAKRARASTQRPVVSASEPQP